MNLRNQKRLSAKLLKVGTGKIHFNPENLPEIKEAITKLDIRGLINQKVITIKKTKQQSKVRARKTKQQKRKGRRKGAGSRKGKKTARLPRKKAWMAKVRTQRKFVKELRDNKKISKETYKEVYKVVGANLFRSKRHIKLYLNDNKLFIKKKNEIQKKK